MPKSDKDKFKANLKLLQSITQQKINYNHRHQPLGTSVCGKYEISSLYITHENQGFLRTVNTEYISLLFIIKIVLPDHTSVCGNNGSVLHFSLSFCQ